MNDDVRTHPTLTLLLDFKNGTNSKPHDIVSGGYEFDGRLISKLNREEVSMFCREVIGSAESIAISGVFAPVNKGQEEVVAMAALGQVSGEIERIYSLSQMSREQAIQDARRLATEEAMNAGVDMNTISIVTVDDIPLAYLPGNALMIRVKAVGDLRSRIPNQSHNYEETMQGS